MPETIKKKESLTLAPNPCASCPYRKDTPSGVWSAEEYKKLPRYDDAWEMSIFLCHSAGGDPKTNNTLCRGWFEVHHQNYGVRLASYRVEWNKANLTPTNVPLYDSGAEACAAGLRRLEHPPLAARIFIEKITARRKARKTKTMKYKAPQKDFQWDKPESFQLVGEQSKASTGTPTTASTTPDDKAQSLFDWEDEAKRYEAV